MSSYLLTLWNQIETSMKIIRLLAFLPFAALAVAANAADTGKTSYSFAQCEGSLTLYPAEIPEVQYPDSLEPVFINHVGRHGARYPSSSASCIALRGALSKADSLGTITPLGRRLAALNERVITLSNGRWGALDSVGVLEQQGIAARMFASFTDVFSREGTVRAISSYSPRAMMSMFAFVHQLDRLNNRNTFVTSTGRVNSYLMRPFDTDTAYLEFRQQKRWRPAFDQYFNSVCPTTAIRRVLGDGFPFESAAAERELAFTEYHVLAGLEAMGLPSEMSVYFNADEANSLWSCFNLRQYLQRTATTVSTVPADIAADLVMDIISTTDAYIDGSDGATCAVLRFGHAETLMPLLSLLHIPGCYYLTNYFDTVAAHWRDFDVVPMAANIQFILFRSKTSGRHYMRVDLNERPVRLRKGDDSIYFPWGELRRYLTNCVPVYVQ